ncbi:YcgJ family protein [Enterobacter cloacae]|uniref:YcgJ family protein n=1 Tax=Enterobacter cloacae TaxID=550 RepID=UPI0009B2ABB1|nr:YcgJ family protein [Enterobacter cloacae]
MLRSVKFTASKRLLVVVNGLVFQQNEVAFKHDHFFNELTEAYLGKKAAANEVFTSSDVDLTEFTFANGILCDVKERLCREDRYYGANGQRSGAVSKKYTKLLFGE